MVEAHEMPLEEFPKSLQKKTQQQLKGMGVEVLTDSKVKPAENGVVTFEDNHTMQATTVV